VRRADAIVPRVNEWYDHTLYSRSTTSSREAIALIMHRLHESLPSGVGRLPLGLRQRFLELERVVDDDDVGTPSGQYPADRGGDARAQYCRLDSGTAWRVGDSRVAKSRWYQSLARMRRQLRESLSARSRA
jgi:hypothetical protein